MRTQADYLDIIKRQKNFKSDYQLAKYWHESTATIQQYRTGRLRLPTAYILEIAELAYYNPLEIILSLEIPRSKHKHKEKLIDAYWRAMVTAVSDRMNINSRSARKCYIYRRFR